MSVELECYAEEFGAAKDVETCLSVAQKVIKYAGEMEHALEWQRGHSSALDSNWSKMHAVAMDAIRAALRMPDASVPDMVRRIKNLTSRLERRERP